MKDTSQFIAICKDRPQDPDGFIYTVYFVNNSSAEISNLEYETYGYCTMDDELVTTNTHRAVLGPLAPFSAVEIEQDDEGSFDFVIIFTFKMTINGTTSQKTVQIGKYLKNGVKPLSPIPVLNKYGKTFYPL